jgi:uncharacterized membrane protein
MGNESDIKNLKEKREYWRTKVFWLLLEIAFIFGIPAALGYFLGRFIQSKYGAGNDIFVLILGATFILSWVIVIIRYKQVKRNLDAVDKEIARQVGTEKKTFEEEDED